MENDKLSRDEVLGQLRALRDDAMYHAQNSTIASVVARNTAAMGAYDRAIEYVGRMA